jgi:hypothetical protein
MQIHQVSQFVQIHRIVWTGDYHSLEPSRVAFLQESIGGVFF